MTVCWLIFWIVGHSRIRIYLANLIVCAIASVLISLSYTVGVFVIGNMNGGELITETATIFLCMISSLMISITFASIMTLLAILNTNKAGNVVVSMILALVLLVSGSFIHQKLGEPKLYDNYVTVNEMGIPRAVCRIAARRNSCPISVWKNRSGSRSADRRM